MSEIKERVPRTSWSNKDVELYNFLADINVDDHVETKIGTGKNKKAKSLKYLSWAWAYNYIASRYPVEFRICEYTPGGVEVSPEEHGLPYSALADGRFGYFVKTEVTIDGITKSMHLPVLDQYNNPVKNAPYRSVVYFNGERYNYVVPALDSMILNTSIMRCLVKTIGLFGLGYSLYAGEDTTAPDAEAAVAAPAVEKKDPGQPNNTEEKPEQETPVTSDDSEAIKAAEEDLKKNAEPEEEEYEVIDADTGERISEQVIEKEPEKMPKPEPEPEPKPDAKEGSKERESLEEEVENSTSERMTLEEVQNYVLVQSPKKLDGHPIKDIFEVYGNAKAVRYIKHYAAKAPNVNDRNAMATLLAALELGDITVPGIATKDGELVVEENTAA